MTQRRKDPSDFLTKRTGDVDWKDLENGGEDGARDGARDGDGGEDAGDEVKDAEDGDEGGGVGRGTGLGSTVFDTQSMRGLTFSSQGMPRIIA